MKNEKAFQKNQLIYEFGILIQPLEDLARSEQPPSLSDLRIAIAKVLAGDDDWRQRVKQFTTFPPTYFLSKSIGTSHMSPNDAGAL